MTPPTYKPVPKPKPVQGSKGDVGPEGPPGSKGAAGSIGPRGPQGAPGRDAIIDSIDYQLLTDEVVARLPPILVNTYDRDGNNIDSEAYPYPGPIKIRYGYLD